jgi:hypothetical protein
MKRLALLPIVLLLVLCMARPSPAAPAWGTNCMSCHGELQQGLLDVYDEDTTADPDESGTGAPDHGTLQVFELIGGETTTLRAQVVGLDPGDRYAVELKRLQFPGVVNGGELVCSPDCAWAEWKNPGNHYTEPEVAHRWGSGPTAFDFEVDVAPAANLDYYDLVFAVAGKYGDTGGLFYDEVHFYLRVAPVPGDIDEDGDVDLSDFSTFSVCFYGPGNTIPPAGCTEDDFAACDLDGDGDVDLSDFSTFSVNFTG